LNCAKPNLASRPAQLHPVFWPMTRTGDLLPHGVPTAARSIPVGSGGEVVGEWVSEDGGIKGT
jgi:hypothetical protein